MIMIKIYDIFNDIKILNCNIFKININLILVWLGKLSQDANRFL